MMKLRLVALLWLTTAGWGAGVFDGKWEPVPADVSREVAEFFAIHNIAMTNNRIELVMNLYTPDATEGLVVGNGEPSFETSIRARRELELKQIAQSGVPPPEVNVAGLQYQPGNSTTEFRIRRTVHKAGANPASDPPTGEICYVFRRGSQGILLHSTISHPFGITRSVSTAPTKPVKLGPDGLPTDVMLSSGLTLHDVVVLAWQEDAVVLKHRGGTDPIKLSRMVPEQRALFESQLKERLAEQKRAAFQAAAVADNQEQMQRSMAAAAREYQAMREEHAANLEEQVEHRHLVVGMTEDQVRRSWGPPSWTAMVDLQGGKCLLWSYGSRGVDEHGAICNAGVAFINDRVIYLINVKNR
jgi:hypothetical protein